LASKIFRDFINAQQSLFIKPISKFAFTPLGF
jgi:hypothetical protein